jgi:hypothetical protein
MFHFAFLVILLRRKMNMAEVTAEFFDNNESASKHRESLAFHVQEDMYRWLESQNGNHVACLYLHHSSITPVPPPPPPHTHTHVRHVRRFL